MIRQRLVGPGALVVCWSLCGCGGGPTPVPPIAFNPAKMAADAMAQYDTNKDGKLDAAELKNSPALADGLADLDTNADKCIETSELAARLEKFKTGGTSILEIIGRVTKGGKGVSGAMVTLEPEKFLGDVVKLAQGTTDSSGKVLFQTAGFPYTGVQLGYFRIQVSLKDAAGKETIPARFNSATTLGREIGSGQRTSLVIDLDRP